MRCGSAVEGKNTDVDACNEDMQDLLQKYHWATHLDRQMAAEAYRHGAKWADRNSRSE
jgi:hypothetical protein